MACYAQLCDKSRGNSYLFKNKSHAMQSPGGTNPYISTSNTCNLRSQFVEKEFPTDGGSSVIDDRDVNTEQHRQKKKLFVSDNLSEGLKQEISMLKSLKKRLNRRDEEDPSQMNNKMSDIEKSVKINEVKIEEIGKTMNAFIGSQNNPEQMVPNQSLSVSYANAPLEYDRLHQENVTLKADTLIFREDINHLSEVNKNLQTELELQRKKVLELIQENDTYQKELAQKSFEVDKLTEAISRLRMFDNPGLEFAIENQKNKDGRIRELEYENKQLIEEKQRTEVENKVIQKRFAELKIKYEDISTELNYIKTRESEQVNQLEEKIQKLEKELEFISKENKDLRRTDEKCRYEISGITKLKEKYEEKYMKKKQYNMELMRKVTELENENRFIKYERSIGEFEKKKESESKPNHIESKQKIIEEMRNKIQLYKVEILKQRSKKGE